VKENHKNVKFAGYNIPHLLENKVIIHYELINDSYYTMDDKSNFPVGEGYDDDIWRRTVDTKLVNKLGLTEEDIDKIQATLPLKIDEFVGPAIMAKLFSAIDPYYQSSLISVVTETNFKNNDIFNTEKIFKPMIHRHPFILVGSYKTLEYLKEMGYTIATHTSKKCPTCGHSVHC
jgi:hypothetical protein